MSEETTERPVLARDLRADERRGPPLLQRRLLWAGAILTAVLALGLGLRRGGTTESSDAQPQRDAPYLDGKLIRFSPAYAARTGIRAAEVAEVPLSPVIEVTGTVTFDTRKFAAVGARIPGRVRRVFKVMGDFVKPQDALAEIESAELGNAEAQVLAARAKETAAEANMKRERRLADAKISPEREAELAEATYLAVRAERIAAEKSVQALGGDLIGELGVFVLKSPIAGKIVAANVARGQTVDSTTTIYEIADLDTLWVELHVFERDIGSIEKGDEVELRLHGAGAGHRLTGTVDHVGDIIDAEARTATVRVVVDNRDGLLRPGQSVAARIEVDHADGVATLSVPRAAVTRVDGQPVVLVLVADNAVEPRPVQLGVEDRDSVAVLGGLAAGEKVVVDGLFALRSELFR